MRFTRRLLLLLLASVVAAIPAAADTILYQLTAFNVAGYTGPFVSVEVNRTSLTTATITFTGLTNGGFLYRLTDGASVAVNVNGSFTLGSITGTSSLPGFTLGPFTDGGSANVDGWGTFNLTINDDASFTHSATSIAFDLTGGSWTSAADVLVANNKGEIAASHIGACDPSNCTAFTDTGFASNAQKTPIPEPSALALFGSGLIGAGTLLRKRHFAGWS